MVRTNYPAISEFPLGRQPVSVPVSGLPSRVTLNSPAIEVMTDLRRVPAALIEPQRSLREAHDAMILRGVRLLLVCDHSGQLEGVISAADLVSERPLQIAQQHSKRRDELAVRDVMTPISSVVAVTLEDLLAADVGHVLETLRRAGRQHTLVVEREADGRSTVRGILSASQLARQLGIPVQPQEVARTFAEIEAALHR